MTSTLPRSAHLTSVQVDPCRDSRWLELARHRDLFHAPPWLRVLSTTYGFDLKASLLLEPNGVARAGFVYATVDDFLGTRIVSLPFSDYCDPLVERGEDWNRLIEGPLATGHRIHLRCLHNQLPAGDERFAVTGRGHWHAIDLGGGQDDLWVRLHPSARRAIRKAEGSGIRVSVASRDEDLAAFYNLHLRVRKYKYGLLVQPRQFFAELHHEFLDPGYGMLLLAQHEGVTVGGVLFLRWGNRLYYKFNASLPEFLEYRPNDLILWEAIRMAADTGIDYIDLGHTDWDHEGLLRYKEKYATRRSEVTYVRRTPPAVPDHKEREARSLLSGLTEVLTDPTVPDELSARAGDLIYRYFV